MKPKYKMAPSKFKELVSAFALVDVSVTGINFKVKRENDPAGGMEDNTRFSISEKGTRWKHISAERVIAVCDGVFTAFNTTAEGEHLEPFVELKYRIEAEYVQPKKHPPEFYRIFAENNLWRILFPFIRELITNVPHRAGYGFPPPPMKLQ